VLQWIEGWNRDVLALQISGADSLLRNVDLVENLQKAASSLSKEHVLGVLSELSSVGEALQKNYNRRMVLENFFLNVSAPGRLPA
jgi:hypothetical protein